MSLFEELQSEHQEIKTRRRLIWAQCLESQIPKDIGAIRAALIEAMEAGLDSIRYVLQPPDVEGLATLEKSVLQDFYRKYYEILKEALVEAGFPESSVKQRWHFLELSVVIDVPPAPSVELEEQDWD